MFMVLWDCPRCGTHSSNIQCPQCGYQKDSFLTPSPDNVYLTAKTEKHLAGVNNGGDKNAIYLNEETRARATRDTLSNGTTTEPGVQEASLDYIIGHPQQDPKKPLRTNRVVLTTDPDKTHPYPVIDPKAIISKCIHCGDDAYDTRPVCPKCGQLRWRD